jgi:beta-lactamase class A
LLKSSPHVFVALVMAAAGLSACLGKTEGTAQGPATQHASSPPAASTPGPQQGGGLGELSERFKAVCERAGGACAVASVHVETGLAAAYGGERALPLYSVFKLPLAVAVLKEVEEGRLRLDQKVRVEADDVAPGVKSN